MTNSETNPTIHDLLSDPIVHQLMAVDGVREEDLLALLHRVARRLRGSQAANAPKGISFETVSQAQAQQQMH